MHQTIIVAVRMVRTITATMRAMALEIHEPMVMVIRVHIIGTMIIHSFKMVHEAINRRRTVKMVAVQT